ncbi:MAG: glycosyltransferase [Oscillospiraceae bacterium]|jgi:glycosyltransferase involved in cell wall biosynthesis|nr:glycosyltransferase [Oscillospiraceae bacterium]
MRILHILPGLGAAGAETFVRNLCLGLQGDDEITQEIAISTLPEQFYEPELRQAGIVIHRTAEFSGFRGLWAHLQQLFRLLRSAGKAGQAYDAVHCHMDYLNGCNLFAAWLAGAPRRICHSHIAVSQAQQPSYAARMYRAVMRRWIRRFATDCCACSPEAGSSMFPWLRAPVVLPNGISLVRFTEALADPSLPQRKQAELALPAKAKLLITAARISEQKNPLFLVDVLAETVRRCPEALLLWCGTGNLEPQVRTRIAALGLEDHVRFLGSRRDMPELLALAECFLLPSRWEGSPLVLAEAQAAALPCMVSDQVSRFADAGGCRFLPLEIGAAGWAEAIAQGLRNGFPEKVDAVRLRRFDIGETCRLYASLLLEG